MKKVLLYLLFFAPLFTQAQLTPELAASLQVELEDAVDFNELEGISAAVVFPNGDVWEGAYGLAGGTDSLTTNHHLYAGSTTKTFTAAAIMQLQEEGKLSVDDDLGMYVGPFTNVDSEITIYQLLTHTSGIYNYTESNDFWSLVETFPTEIITPAQVLDLVEVPVFTPGTEWGYSNTNYTLLSLIIEAIEQKELDVVYRERFIDPLGYETMFLGASESSIGPYAGMYLDQTGNGQLDDLSFFETNSLLSGAWGAGAMATTPEDLAQWVKKLYGTTDVVSEDSYNDMITGSEFEPSYGLGTIISDYQGCNLYGHSGGIIHTTEMRYIKEHDFSVSMMINGGNYNFLGFIAIVDKVKAALEISSSDELSDALDLKVYPNPFTTAFNVEITLENASSLDFTIYDALGNKVGMIPNMKGVAGYNLFKMSDYMDINSFSNGTYFYSINTEDGRSNGTIIKI